MATSDHTKEQFVTVKNGQRIGVTHNQKELAEAEAEKLRKQSQAQQLNETVEVKQVIMG